jgi:hypothetical protein
MTAILPLVLLLLSACGGDPPGRDGAGGSLIEAVLDRSDPEPLLRYYLGGYVAPGGGDPYVAGLLHAEGSRLYLDPSALNRLHTGMGDALASHASKQRLDWDGFEAFLLETFYEARGAPSTLQALRDTVEYGGDGWFSVELDGVMTTARRRVYASESAVREALRAYADNDGRLLYPAGTTFVGEHVLDGDLIEATVMRKREDGAWDFLTYGSDGALTTRTQAQPRALKTPTQCVGCHFGAKAFEPARSFPGTAPDGPHGPRAYYLDAALRDAEVVTYFDEHRKRSDRVLGLYSTLFVARLRATRNAGGLDPSDAELLATLGL